MQERNIANCITENVEGMIMQRTSELKDDMVMNSSVFYVGSIGFYFGSSGWAPKPRPDTLCSISTAYT